MAVTRHQYRIYIKAPIQQVWSALIEPEFTRRYFHGSTFDAPPVAGEPYRTSMGEQPAVDGTIEVLEPPYRLVQTWHVLYHAALADEPPSRVEWTLSEAGEGLTQVDLIHGDLARSPLTWAHVRTGWVWILDGLKTLLETGEELPPADGAPQDAIDDPSAEWHRAQGIECNNSIWDLVGEPASPERDEELLRRAFASAYHWQRAAGTGPVNEVRARYMLAKVHHLTGQPDRSLHYADSCLAMCEDIGLVDFDLAYAHEARARALKGLGRIDEAQQAWDAALAVPIADPEDKAIVDGDMADGL
ncbi:MAG: SRPBCC domain-containing protein [Ilumatobacteraceae bacterium]